MKIVICIKQVPDTSDIKWTENNTISREGVESILNPLDLYAIDTALKIKKQVRNCEISVVSMGPMQAKEVIKRAISLGCDSGYLLSDKKFAGADTYATAKTLAAFVSKKIPDVDLILCGQFASDGDTAQTGPSLATQLNIPVVSYVKNVDMLNDKLITERETETSFEKYEVDFPCLLCISKGEYETQRPRIQGFIKAQNTEIEVLSAADVDINPEETGIKGSPTYVSRAFTPSVKRDGEMFFCEDLDNCVDVLVEKIREYD